MWVVDTNVISELMRPQPDGRVIEWVGKYPAGSFFITTITEAELRFGMEILPTGKRKQALQRALETMLDEDFAQRILPFDRDAARRYADIVVHRRRKDKPIAQFDAQIAAIARSRNAIVATRNTADFADCGVELVNPWNSH